MDVIFVKLRRNNHIFLHCAKMRILWLVTNYNWVGYWSIEPSICIRNRIQKRNSFFPKYIKIRKTYQNEISDLYYSIKYYLNPKVSTFLVSVPFPDLMNLSSICCLGPNYQVHLAQKKRKKKEEKRIKEQRRISGLSLQATTLKFIGKKNI